MNRLRTYVTHRCVQTFLRGSNLYLSLLRAPSLRLLKMFRLEFSHRFAPLFTGWLSDWFKLSRHAGTQEIKCCLVHVIIYSFGFGIILNQGVDMELCIVQWNADTKGFILNRQSRAPDSVLKNRRTRLILSWPRSWHQLLLSNVMCVYIHGTLAWMYVHIMDLLQHTYVLVTFWHERSVRIFYSLFPFEQARNRNYNS